MKFDPSVSHHICPIQLLKYHGHPNRMLNMSQQLQMCI